MKKVKITIEIETTEKHWYYDLEDELKSYIEKNDAYGIGDGLDDKAVDVTKIEYEVVKENE